MTLDDWVARNHGTVIKVPAGTTIGHVHEYQYPLDHPEHPGEWSSSTDAWKVKIGNRYRPVLTERDEYYEIRLEGGQFYDLVTKARRSKQGQSRDGGVMLKRVRQ